ncbi:holocytochrome-c synthase [Powellomyces hirtus]|uniref:Holocytochrome c-type synthase n=1 Tax=Powellomyces hirtus TaxID=109895 RepID=A0A507E2W8_9FUNG|nr:holocytochrome-c synthase [Powellomyces hirtus]
MDSKTASASKEGSCPVDHSSFAAMSGKPAPTSKASSCPVDHASLAALGGKSTPPSQPSASTTTSSSSSGCPVDHTGSSTPLNPLNMMPNLSQTPAAEQEAALPTARTQSSIPRSDAKSTWEYPSPQQFYNALVRKGYETPVHEVSGMVDIHNFLNEACWDEIRKWEKRFHCDCKDLKLKKFQGRPKDLTPKARVYSWFGVDKPFDRHDWTVDRCGEDVRYVLDYYSSPDEMPGMPVFNVDVRPALDSPSAIFDRARMGAQRIWEKVFGAPAEEEE